MEKVKIYFGAPLFSRSEQLFNELIVSEIREVYGKYVDVYLPQENDSINDKSGYADSLMIYNGDNEYLDKADILIAHIDGQVADVGLAAEVGRFAHISERSHKKKFIVGLYTDSRQGTYGNQLKLEALDEVAESQFSYINLYLVGAIKNNGKIFTNEYEMLLALETYINKIIEEKGEIK